MARLPDLTALPRAWLASYPPGVPSTYDLPAVDVGRLLADAVRDFPAHPALVVGRESVDYTTLDTRVAAMARVLTDGGLDAGDRLLLGMENGLLLPTAMLAAWRLGAVVVPVPARLSGDRLGQIVRHTTVDAVVGTEHVLETLRDQSALPAKAFQSDDGGPVPTRLRRLRRRTRGLPTAVGRSRERATVRMLRDELDSPVPDATGGSPERPGTHRNTNPDANALIVYEPEGSSLHGVVFHHRELVAGAFQTRLWVPDIQAGRERILVADPLYDTVALVGGLLTGLLSAATVVLLPDGGGAALGRTIARSRPTVLLITSGRLQALVADAAGRSDLSSLRVVMVSGPHLPSDVAAELERRTGGARVRHGYATTGSGSFVHAQPVYGKVTPGAMGVPVTGTVASVVAPDDLSVPCPSGEVGRLLVAGPQVATAYWNDKEGTAHRFVDGWMVTDELVTVDGDGVFRHVGRLPSSASPIVERAPIRRTGPTGSHWA